MTESRIHEQPAPEGDLAVVVTRRPHQEGCPALSGDNPCRCYENAIPNRDEHWCPRRSEGVVGNFPGPDTWDTRGGLVGAVSQPHCSFCGSLHPDTFMALASTGVELGPTDKNYKVYLSADPHTGPNGDKFYFQHLSEAQRDEFIRLVNDRKLNIGYPGHFYRLPFFVARPPKAP